MEHPVIENITGVLAYVEASLAQKTDLETVAKAAHYSKYHLHRMFSQTVGMTLHDYVQRRRLTEAAKLLVFSGKPILEIALTAGYESQQAFTGTFKALYKKPPLEYRAQGIFYPLKLPFVLHTDPSPPENISRNISFATKEDIPAWMDFVPLVIEGFPCFDEKQHLRRLQYYIEQKQALLLRDRQTIAGAAAFSREAGSIDFLDVHPQYRRHGIGKALLDFLMDTAFSGREISITTFREGDKADTGQRAAYKRLGFAEAEPATEFGYPVQRLVRKPRETGQQADWPDPPVKE